jgi:predicted dienelactone hydrolase
MKKIGKWFRWVSIVIVTLIGGLIGYAMLTALGTEHPVGFQIIQATDEDGQPFTVGVWYPTQEQPWPTTLLSLVLMNVARDAPVSGSDLPLVVISHGNGGGPASHADVALALANAGYIVVAPMHAGDNYADQSAFGSATWLSGRTLEVHATPDYMLNNWQGHDHIDPDRIGAFGFSAGGFTVLTAVGAQPDLSIVAKHCADSAEFVCDLLHVAKSPMLDTSMPTIEGAFLPDLRIKAAVVAAPVWDLQWLRMGSTTYMCQFSFGVPTRMSMFLMPLIQSRFARRLVPWLSFILLPVPVISRFSRPAGSCPLRKYVRIKGNLIEKPSTRR